MSNYGSSWGSDQNGSQGSDLLRDSNGNNNNGNSKSTGHVSSATMPAAFDYNNNGDESDDEAFPLLRKNLQERDSPPTQTRRRISYPTTHGNNHNNHHHHHSAVRFHHREDYWSASRNHNNSGRSAAIAKPDDHSILTVDHHWLPDAYDDDDESEYHQQTPPPLLLQNSSGTRGPRRRLPRSLKRRCFLFLTEFESSRGSAIFFVLLMVSIFVMNVVMIMQTMHYWQYTPDDCVTCGGTTLYTFEDDESILFEEQQQHAPPCVCPPAPIEWTDTVLRYLIYFFTVEWILRVLLFEPPNNNNNNNKDFWRLFFDHLTDPATILDALAIFPFYLESIENTNGLMSLRLLRLFRVFQLLRLGQYNTTFWSLTNVLKQSILYLRLLVLVLVFGASLFGSLMYYLEKGTWRYHEESRMYRFMRIGVDGNEEPSPFTSIPAAFWWFLVTATTVGYGDVYPTSFAGKCVAAGAMLSGVLVVAFPVSVFSDLWAKEVQRHDHDNSGTGGPGLSLSPPAGEGRSTTPIAVANIGGVDDAMQHQHYQYQNNNNNKGESGAKRARDVEVFWSSLRRLSSPMMASPPQVERSEKEKGEEETPEKSVKGKDDDDDDDAVLVGAGLLSSSSVKLTTQKEEEENHYHHHYGATATATATTTTRGGGGGGLLTGTSSSSTKILSLQPEDVQEIMNRLDTIRENENRIRSILQKYHHQP